jgi:hypothetical protein
MDKFIRILIVLIDFPDLFTEVMRMRLCSIETIQFCGHHRGEHFALNTRERRVTHHNCAIETDTIPHRAGMYAHNVDNIPDPARSL